MRNRGALAVLSDKINISECLPVSKTKQSLMLSAPRFGINPKAYASLFLDPYNRFRKPFKYTAFLAAKFNGDGDINQIVINQFPYDDLIRFAQFVKNNYTNPDDALRTTFIPQVKTLTNLTALRDSNGNIIINGYTPCGVFMSGRPLCTITVTRKDTPERTDKFNFYSLIPDREFAQVTIPKFNPAAEKKLKKLQGHFTLFDSVDIVNSDIPKRAALKRDPDQNTVMGRSASSTLKELYNHEILSSVMTPEFKSLLIRLMKIKHSATLRALEKRQQGVSQEEKDFHEQYKVELLEWLHLIGFRLSPFSMNPQNRNNLAAARAAHNTEMILIESLANYIATNISESRNRLTGKFCKIPFTDFIDTGELSLDASIDGNRLVVSQKFDALVRKPEELRISDVSGLVGTTMMLLQGIPPKNVHTVPVLSTEPMVVPGL